MLTALQLYLEFVDFFLQTEFTSPNSKSDENIDFEKDWLIFSYKYSAKES